MRLQHLIQVSEISNLDEIGIRIVQTYFSKYNDRLTENLHKLFIDQANFMTSQYREATDLHQGTQAFEYLQLAVNQFSDIYDNLTPNSLKDGSPSLSIDNMKKLHKNLSSFQSEMFVIYLLWCGYLIHR